MSSISQLVDLGEFEHGLVVAWLEIHKVVLGLSHVQVHDVALFAS